MRHALNKLDKLRVNVRVFLSSWIPVVTPMGEYVHAYENKNFKVALYLAPEGAYLCQYDGGTDTWKRLARYDKVCLAIRTMKFHNKAMKSLTYMTLDNFQESFRTLYYSNQGFGYV